MTNIEKPMNPFATEDFKRAIERANKCLTDLAEQAVIDFPYMNFDDMTEADELTEGIKEVNEKPLCYEGGRALLNYRINGAYDDFINILIANGYEVTAHLVNDELIEIRFKS